MKEPEDEAFDELAKRQGYWNMQGSRKHQIMQHIEECTLAFGRDTVASFASYIRGMKR